MNPAALLIFGLMTAASIIGAANFTVVADGYFARRPPVAAPVRCPASVPEQVKTVIGHTETVALGEERGMVFIAKVDSGADSSSMHATDIRTLQRELREQGQVKQILFVRFKTQDDLGRELEVERMVSRIDQVKSASGIHTRYFFREKLWIHDRAYEIEMNLADRSRMSKKMLVGKNLLNQGYLIDANQAYVVTRSINDKL
jgi:hypothetical protein